MKPVEKYFKHDKGKTMKEDIKLQPYWKILLGNILFAGFVLSVCRASLITTCVAALVVIGVLLPMAVGASISASKGEREQWRQQMWKQRWTRFAIYAVAVFAGAVLANQAREDEKRNFDSIISAVDRYKAAENRYPDTLDQLAPKYLASVPTGKFMYYTDPDHSDAHLSHVSTLLPESYSYDFKSKKRSISD